MYKNRMSNKELIQLLEREYNKVLRLSKEDAEVVTLNHLKEAGLLDENEDMKQNLVNGDFFEI